MAKTRNDAVRNRLLDAGIRVLSRDAVATTQEIADAAGIAKSGIHYYYPGRDGKKVFVRDAYRRAIELGTVTPALHVAAIVLSQRDPELAAFLPAHFSFNRDEVRPLRAVAAE